MAEPVLKLTNVRKTINKQPIVKGVDLELYLGQVMALCGGNGAGKSTLLRMIVGSSQPTEGSIEACGLQWRADRMRYAASVGYMPDDYVFGQALSARETLTFWAKLRNVPPSRVQELLHKVGLAEVQQKPVTSFSKGMRQRLLFAQALLGDPPLLVLDEPTNGLDPYWLQSFVHLIEEVKREGRAVIFSTHHLQVAESVADRAMFLRNGELVRQGSIDEFREHYGPKGLDGAFTEFMA
ncbi:ABC transporter ATP-binding protein [Paenibacillus tyrfis]|uniref:ABC transporter ATP-binding protein n=1 Tax=Paenibacillus tyrfis TaxID=1501230 RepID=A0A081P7M8_9BACL|nr:ABC transporter ATP-binding protein [Paenibacillus tyrfis]KEQ26701.1 ABC transporter ATP-binding protein [Paenibacillus tyrfis]